MITPSFSLTATERVLPKLALDFTTASLDARVTFTRTTDATHPAIYVNSSGFITAATNNQPRFDYDPVTLSCKGLLIEESRTNLFTYSEDISQAAWSKTNTTVGATTTTSPTNGTANSISATTPGAYLEFYQTVTVSASATYTYSCFLHSGVASTGTVRFRDVASISNRADVIFNLSTQIATAYVYGTYTNGSCKLVNYGGGWYRVELTFTVGANTSVKGGLYQSGGESGGFYIWGAQLEAGAFATSYIPTTSAALTRNADVATMTGTNFSDWWQATNGGVLVRARPGTVSGVRPWVQFDDGTANEIIALRGNTTNPELYIVDDGTPQAQIDAGTIAANTDYRFAAGWKLNDCAASINSGTPVLDGAATLPTVTQARLGCDGTNYLNGHFQTIEYYNRKPTSETLQQLTSSAGRFSVLSPILRQVVQS